MLRHGDLFDVLPTLEAESVDACVTDPPYGIGFMGRKWDTFKPGVEQARIIENADIESDNPNVRGRKRRPASSPSAVEYDRSLAGQREFQAWTERWAREVFRVLKPGAHLLVSGAPRSFHRMSCGIEDAGFDVRDTFSWLFGQGFPKSRNIGDGRGTGLKPGWEPIVVARKPFRGSVTANVARFGTGAINVDACKIEGAPRTTHADGNRRTATDCPTLHEGLAVHGAWPGPSGRWPANVVLSHSTSCCEVGTKRVKGSLIEKPSGREFAAFAGGGLGGARSARGIGDADNMETVEVWDCSPDCPMRMLDEMSGDVGAGGKASGPTLTGESTSFSRGRFAGITDTPFHGDSGGASRFFYTAKPSREERNLGCDSLPVSTVGVWGGAEDDLTVGKKRVIPQGNTHPTVKPLALMRWLVRLVTPPGGLVLDPFTGSGTTGMACAAENLRFLGIEREAEYIEIATRRIASIAPLFSDEATA